MPTFTDASLIAAGAAALLWTFLADDSSPRRRTVVGFLGFVSLEAAVFMPYTDVVVLLVAVIAVVATFRKASVPTRSLAWWGGSLVVFAAGAMAFDQVFYGGPLKTGYGAGEITFSLGAVIPNLHHMPPYLVKAMPAAVLAFAASAWIALKLLRSRCAADAASMAKARRDGLVGLVLAAGWCGIWALYSAYNWTVQAGVAGGGPGGGGGGGDIHVIRFYVPAIGLIALLGAWLLVQLPKWFPAALLVAVAVLGFMSFRDLTAVGAVGMPGEPVSPAAPVGTSHPRTSRAIPLGSNRRRPGCRTGSCQGTGARRARRCRSVSGPGTTGSGKHVFASGTVPTARCA